MSNETVSKNALSSPLWGESLAACVTGLVFGLTGALVNFICLIVVWRNKVLHTPCFINIGVHSIYFFFMSVGYLTNGIELLGFSFGFMTMRHTRITCYFMHMTMLVSIPTSAVITCFLSVDRFLALLFPVRYRNLGHSLTAICLSLSGLAGISCALASGFTLPRPLNETIYCPHFLASYHPTYTKFHTNFVLSCYILTVILYISILFAVKYKKLQLTINSSTHSQDFRRFLKHQLNTLPMVKLLTVVYLTFGMIPPFMSFLFASVEHGKYAVKGWYYAHMIKVLLATVEFVAITTRCAEFRLTKISPLLSQYLLHPGHFRRNGVHLPDWVIIVGL